MDDDFYITDNISIMSRLKEPSHFGHQEHSLSKIIREQALNYEEEHLSVEWKAKDSANQDIRTNRTDQKAKNHHENFSNPEFREAGQPQGNPKKQSKQQPNRQKIEKRRREAGNDNCNPLSINRKGNFLIFNDDEKESKNSNNSKKQKRAENVFLQQQKTKKIEFQDIDRYKLHSKKEEPTKIRHMDDNQENAYNLDIQSKDNSEDPTNYSDLQSLTQNILANYNVLNCQIKQQISMVKFQYIEAEKIDIRKMISKLEADIRRKRIGFRGLSDSIGKGSTSSGLSLSKLRGQEEAEGKGNLQRRKGEVATNKVESRIMKAKNASDYGLQSQVANQNQQNLNDKLLNLEQNHQKMLAKESMLSSKLNQLEKRYNVLRANNQQKQQSLLKRTEANKSSGSILERSKLLKEKISFLKNQLRETKVLFNNKLKRLKNQNTILTNENVYISKEIDIIKQNKKNSSKQPKKASNTKQNLLLFDEVEVKNNYQDDGPSKAISTNKNFASNLGSINDVKSLQSINSARSFNSINSKPSMGSINSKKSTKIESPEKKRSIELHNPMRNKLKINSPHHLSPPSLGQLKQNSFVKRLNGDNEPRGITLHKKTTSLDVAIKQLQQKYTKHMHSQEAYQSDEYYR